MMDFYKKKTPIFLNWCWRVIKEKKCQFDYEYEDMSNCAYI